jgi:uncharacterized membrane protein YjjP (DUF1212 family)
MTEREKKINEWMGLTGWIVACTGVYMLFGIGGVLIFVGLPGLIVAQVRSFRDKS